MSLLWTQPSPAGLSPSPAHASFASPQVRPDRAYLNLTRGLYKDLVAVHKTAAGTLQVSSYTYEISEASGSSASLFSAPRSTTATSPSVVARNAKLWYAAWFPMM